MIPARRKYAVEIRAETFDFSEQMDVLGGETLTGATFPALPGGITASAPSIVGPLVTARFAGGTAGQDYEIQCVAPTSTGQILKLIFVLEVRDDAN